MQKKIIVVVLLIVGLLGVNGCGSSSGTLRPTATTTGRIVTRANAASFTTDAKLLAARESTDGWISADTAAQADQDLTAIRTHTPAVADVHILPDFSADTILVEVPKTSSWYSAWASGHTTTGVAAIDALSTTYHLSSVSTVGTYEFYSIFKLTFADLLATDYIAASYKKADAGIRDAYVNYNVGGGDNIIRRVDGSDRLYSLSQGWGDCPAGCIYHHTWAFTLTSSGGITVEESGTPLP